MQEDSQCEKFKAKEIQIMSWDPKGGIALTGRDELMIYDSQRSSQSDPSDEFSARIREELLQDISVIMRERVSKGYSMDCAKNIEIVDSDSKLLELWLWVQRCERIAKESAQTGSSDHSFHGVYGIWMGTGIHGRKPSSPANAPRSHFPSPKTSASPIQRSSKASRESPTQPSGYVDTHSNTGGALMMAHTLKAAQRESALAVCGFSSCLEDVEHKILHLESGGEQDKASALALFCGLHERAIQSLTYDHGPNQDAKDAQQRKLMSAILAGYQPSTEGANITLRSLCESLKNDMIDRPYLCAILSYIASNDWYAIINDPNLPLAERVAVALRVLDDEQMTAYLNGKMEYLIEEGDIEGIIVTGLTGRGVDLMEQSLNRTGDIQTASLLMSFAVPRRFKDKRVEDWVENYRLLLDRWQQWYHRSRFDIERGQRMSAGEIAPPQVYVRCTYCAQSLGHSLLIQNVRNRDGKRVNVQTNVSPVSGGRLSGKQKSTVCPSCRKQLPRCALCLLYMGTPIDPLRQAIASNDAHSMDPGGFDLWFTWCQSCRHGGHAVHMLDWFQKHAVCPVSSCSCECQNY